MGERVPVGQVRRSTKGGLVRVLGFGVTVVEVVQLDTGKVYMPSKEVVERWEVVHAPR